MWPKWVTCCIAPRLRGSARETSRLCATSEYPFSGCFCRERQASMSETVDEIWAGDPLRRREEAELLAGYIESILDRPRSDQQPHAYTIAVDAGYGEGKTFFLNRLARHLKLKHPVAFIDAWADDLADQPLVALMATIKSALAPVLGEPKVKSGWSKLAEKSGKVATLAAVGAAKRGLGILISHSAVDAISGLLEGADDATIESTEDSIKDTTKEVINEAAKSLKISGNMERQVKDFHDAQTAMNDMKASLKDVVDQLGSTDLSAPIIIVIDELDRCRPSYAIKLLEEIKHLFDVLGVVFVFGLHGDQLSHSVRGAYGPIFDGKDYLRKFINRRYTLNDPDYTALVSQLLNFCGITRDNFLFPTQYKDGSRRFDLDLPLFVALYAKIFKVSARDLFELCDRLETSVAVAKPYPLILPYLLPLIVGHMRGLPLGENPPFSERPVLTLISNRDNQEIDAASLFNRLKSLASMTNSQLSQAYNHSEGYPEAVVASASMEQHQGANEYALPSNYLRLLSAVSRFSKD
jgi:hypothetical protein